MRKFEILRYIKKFSVFILLFAIIGSFAIYFYGKKNQQYTATTVIKYTNSAISSGLAPDGSPLDVNEIYSSTVIAQAMELLGLKNTPEIIRSRCKVTPIIPEEQQTINEALAEKGEEITYFPDTYKIELMVDNDKGAVYARNVLDAIIESYFSIYTEKYVEQRLSSNPSKDLLEKGYDYYQCICMLEEDTSKMIDFLKSKRKVYSNFRSSVTGYSFSDLLDIYSNMKDYEVPKLYAMVVDGPQVKNAEYLKKSLSDEIKESINSEAVQIERKDYLKNIIDNFSDKNQSIMDYHYKSQLGETSDTDYILKDVYGKNDGKDVETTYDDMLLEYVALDKAIKEEAIKRESKSSFLNIIQDIESESGTADAHKTLENQINNYEQRLAQTYTLVNDTSKELNRYLSADFFQIKNSVRVNQKINIRQYVILAIIFFLLVGVIGAIILGRLTDIIEYLLYVDKKTGLPNRESCDNFIAEMEKQTLPDNYSGFVFEFLNLESLNKHYGYSVVDNILKDFADLLKSTFTSSGNIFHNNKGVFVGFMPQCSEKKAEAVLQAFGEYINEYNNLNPNYAIEYRGASTTSTNSEAYSIRELINKAFKKLKSESENKDN